jgi:hypothetical protein
MDQMPFLNSVFAVTESITKAELTNTSKRLIISYINQSTQLPLIERSIQAIIRYTQTQIPTPDQIRQGSQSADMISQLILKLESEASKLG